LSPRVTDRLRRVAGRSRGRFARTFWALARLLPGRAIGAVEVTSQPLHGWVSVEGWAYRRRDPVVAVIVTMDGDPVSLGEPGVARADVARHHRGGERSGWTARVDVRGTRADVVSIGALAVTRSGLVESIAPRVLHLRHSSELGGVSRPQDGMRIVAGPILVEGWVLPPLPPARIEVSVNDRAAGRARPFAGPHAELAATSQLPWAPMAAFGHVVDLSRFEVGERVRIDADVVTIDGRRSTLDGVEIEIAAPPPIALPAGKVAELARNLERDPQRTPDSSMAPVRLLVVTHQLDLGGGQLYLYEMLRHVLAAFDVSCLVVSTTDGVLRSKLEDLGAFVHVCGRPSTDEPEHYERLLTELAELVDAHDCNVAIVNTMSCAFGADLATRLGIPTVWAVHESYTLGEFFLAAYGENGLHPYMRERTAAALAAASAMVFEADATRRLYESNGDPRRFITIPYGIPVAEVDAYRARTNRAELRRAQGFADEEVVILCMGTYEPRKGQGSLALAFAEIASEFPDAVLVMVGDTGIPYAKAVRQVVERLRLDHRIRLMPVVEDVYAWYLMADALVTVSDVESLPRSVLEAMCLGVPVVAVDVFGLGELLTDGATGLLCEPRDVEGMVDALRRMLSATPVERARIGHAGADLVHRAYDSAGYGGAYLQLIRGLVADPNKLPGELV
jgi:glycosyltransferase involved in cell wall biosynthesis